jgi:hypothetical protein
MVALAGGELDKAALDEESAARFRGGDRRADMVQRDGSAPGTGLSDAAGGYIERQLNNKETEWQGDNPEIDWQPEKTEIVTEGHQPSPRMRGDLESAEVGKQDVEVDDSEVQRSSIPASDQTRSTGSIQAEVMGQTEQVQVLLDGEKKGATPALLQGIEPGVHRLTFVLGDQLWEEEVRVPVGDTMLVACSLLDPLSPGQVFIEAYRDARGAVAGTDSVFVNSEFRGRGETTLELSPGFHSISFARAGTERRHVILHVTSGSAQHVPPPNVRPAVVFRHTRPERDGTSVVFAVRLQPAPPSTPDVAICFVPPGKGRLKTARMGLRASDGALVAALPTGSLPTGPETRYFYRATLTSGEEIDSQLYTFDSSKL